MEIRPRTISRLGFLDIADAAKRIANRIRRQHRFDAEMNGGTAGAVHDPGSMIITRTGKSDSRKGRNDWFTGTVWINSISTAPNPSDVHVLRVSFEPSARTAWHTHPHGQLLHILTGIARVQKAGEKVVEAFPGDSVWFEPGEKHWHGASPQGIMVHLAVQKSDSGGETTQWMELVTDAEYK